MADLKSSQQTQTISIEDVISQETEKASLPEMYEEALREEIQAQFQLQYLVLPLQVYTRNDLSWLEARILAFVYTYSRPKFYFSNRQLAQMFRCDERSIRRAISSLHEKGLLDIRYERKAYGVIRYVSVPNAEKTDDRSGVSGGIQSISGRTDLSYPQDQLVLPLGQTCPIKDNNKDNNKKVTNLKKIKKSWGENFEKQKSDENQKKENPEVLSEKKKKENPEVLSEKEKNLDLSDLSEEKEKILSGLSEEKHENIVKNAVKNAPLVKNFTNEIQNLPPHQKALLPPRVKSEKMIEAVGDLTPEDFEDLKVLVKTVLNSDITSDTKLKVFLINLRLHKFSSWNGVKEFLLQIRTFRRKTDVKDMNLDSIYRKYFYEIRKMPIYSSDTEVSASYSSVAQAVQDFRRYIDCAYAVQEFAVHWAHAMLRSIKHSQIFAELKPFLSETFDQFGYQVYRLSDVDGFKHYVKQIYYSQQKV